MLAWVDRFVAPPTSPTLKPAPPIGGRDGTLHVQVSPDDSTYRIRNVRPDGARTHVRRPSAQEVQDRLRQLPSPGVANLPRRSNSFNRSSNNHLPPSPATPIAPARRHQPGTADLHLRLNVQDVNPVWDGTQDRTMVERLAAPAAPRTPLVRAPPPRPPRPSNVNLFDDEPPKRPPALSFSSSTSSGQSSRNGSPQTPTSPTSPSGWTSYYTDRSKELSNERQQQQVVEPPLPPLPAPMPLSPPASMGFGRRAKSPPAFSTRPINASVMENLTGGTTNSGSLTSIGNLMANASAPERESWSALGLDDNFGSFDEKALDDREEERSRDRESRGSRTTRRERSQAPPAPDSIPEEPERQNAFSRLRDFTRARSKSLGRESSRRRRTPSPPSRPPPLPTSPLVSTPNSARTIRPRAPSSPRPLYHMDFLAPQQGRDSPNNGPPSRPHSVAVSESSVITAGGTRYNIRNKTLRVVNAAPPSASGSSRGSIASRSSLGSTITALFSHSSSSKSSVSDKTSSSKSSERLASLKAQALEADIYRALNMPHAPYYSPSLSSRGASPLPPPSFTFQDYCSSPASETGSSPSSPRPRYTGIVDPHNRLEFDVRQTLEELSSVEEEVFGKGRVRPWEKEPDLEDPYDAAMSLETLIRVDRRKRGKRPERRGPVALRIPRR